MGLSDVQHPQWCTSAQVPEPRLPTPGWPSVRVGGRGGPQSAAATVGLLMWICQSGPPYALCAMWEASCCCGGFTTSAGTFAQWPARWFGGAECPTASRRQGQNDVAFSSSCLAGSCTISNGCQGGRFWPVFCNGAYRVGSGVGAFARGGEEDGGYHRGPRGCGS